MTEGQRKAADVVGRGGSDDEAGKAAGVTRDTITRWRRDERYRALEDAARTRVEAERAAAHEREVSASPVARLRALAYEVRIMELERERDAMRADPQRRADPKVLNTANLASPIAAEQVPEALSPGEATQVETARKLEMAIGAAAAKRIRDGAAAAGVDPHLADQLLEIAAGGRAVVRFPVNELGNGHVRTAKDCAHFGSVVTDVPDTAQDATPPKALPAATVPTLDIPPGFKGFGGFGAW